MNHLRQKSLYVAITFMLGQSAFAETELLNEVVVNDHAFNEFGSNRVNASVLAQKRTQTSDTTELMNDMAGVSSQSAGGVSNLPIIHGLADDRLRIKVDGMDLVASCPNHMNSPLSYVSPTAVDKVTVYKGVSPVSVGGDSIGGSIVVETAQPKFAKEGESLTEGEVGASYHSNGSGHRENVTLTHATDSFNVTYRGSAAQSDNYKAGGDFKSSTYAQNLNGWQTQATNNGSSTSPYATGWMNSKTLGLNEVGSSAYKSYNQELGFAFKLNRDILELKYGYQHIPYELYPNQRMDMLDNEQKRINLRYLADLSWGTLEARAYNESTNHFMDFGSDKQYWYGYNAAYTYNPATNTFTNSAGNRAFVATGMPMYTEGHTLGTSLKADIKLKDQEILRVGTDIQQYKLNDWWPSSPANDGLPYYNASNTLVTAGGMYPNTFQNINNGRRDRLAVWSELETQRNAEWKTLLGARIEKVDTNADNVQGYNSTMMNYGTDSAAFNATNHQQTDVNLDLSALAKYTPDSMKSYDFGLARKVRSPNLYERYTWANSSMAMVMNNFVGDGNGYVGNPDLKPEVAHTASVTASYHDAERTWELNVTPYYTLVDNYIDAKRLASYATATNKFVLLQFANQNAQIYGLDVAGRMPLAKNDLGNWGLKGIISYVRGTNMDTHDDLYNIMPLNAKFTLTHQLAKWSNGLELVMVADKSDVSDVRNEVKTAGYNIMNLRSSYAYNKQVRLDFGVENIADTLYYMPLGGAYTGQGTTMNIQGTPYGVGVAGIGRSIYTGVTYKF